MSVAAGRIIELEGVVNVRDLGGWAAGARRVRTGQLYRSGALHAATPAGAVRLRDELGVRLVVDLRTDREIDLDGLGPVAGPPVAHMQLVLLEAASDPTRAATLADRYLEMFERAGGPLGRLLETLAATSEPVLLHCFAGKDRTGVAAAVILGALGVSEEDIVVDYARTQAALPAIRASLEASRAFSAVVDQFPPETLHAAPETMERVLAKVRSRHGDLVGYARSIGVSDETLAALAARLLED